MSTLRDNLKKLISTLELFVTVSGILRRLKFGIKKPFKKVLEIVGPMNHFIQPCLWQSMPSKQLAIWPFVWRNLAKGLELSWFWRDWRTIWSKLAPCNPPTSKLHPCLKRSPIISESFTKEWRNLKKLLNFMSSHNKFKQQKQRMSRLVSSWKPGIKTSRLIWTWSHCLIQVW